jgi:outer membrane protein
MTMTLPSCSSFPRKMRYWADSGPEFIHFVKLYLTKNVLKREIPMGKCEKTSEKQDARRTRGKTCVVLVISGAPSIHLKEYAMRFASALLASALLMLFASQAQAQQGTMTLEQAIQIGLKKNLGVIQADNNVDAANSGVLAAFGGYLPTLNASAGWQRTQQENAGQAPQIYQGIVIPGSPAGTTVSSNFNTYLSANFNIFDGLNREARLGQAKSGAAATEQVSYRTRQSTVNQVESAYLTVLRNEQLVKVNEENLKRDQRQLERISESNKVGAAAIADVYRQQSQVAVDELALITAQNAFDKSKADLLALIGLDVSDEYVFVDSTISPELTKAELDSASTYTKNLNELTQRALVARPDYLAAAENLSNAESGVTGARSTYFPSVSAFAQYRMSNSELNKLSQNKTYNWGLTFQWTLFDGFRTNQALQSAIVQKRNAEISLVQTGLGVSVDVKKALLDLDAARKAYEVSQKGLISASADRNIAEERYNLGAGTLLDLMVANANLVNAEASKINAAYSYVYARRSVEYVVGERAY